MNDMRVSKLAELLVKYSVAVKKGDKVKIRGDYAAAPLVQAVYAEVLKSGGHPIVFLEPEGLAEILYKYASEEQLKLSMSLRRLLPINMMLQSLWVVRPIPKPSVK